MQEGYVISNFALALDRRHSKRPRPDASDDNNDNNAHNDTVKRLRHLETCVESMYESMHKRDAFHMSPLNYLAVKRTAKRLFWGDSNRDVDSVGALQSMIASIPLKNNEQPVMDHEHGEIFLERCARHEDAMRLAMAIILVDQQHLQTSIQSQQKAQEKQNWDLAFEKERSVATERELTSAQQTIAQLETKLRSTEEQATKVQRALRKTTSTLRDTEHLINHLRSEQREAARHHAEAICDRIMGTFVNLRKWIHGEVSDKWVKHFKIRPDAANSLEDLLRTFMTRMRAVIDANVDTVALGPTALNHMVSHGRELMRASAPPPIARQGSSSPSYIPNDAPAI